MDTQKIPYFKILSNIDFTVKTKESTLLKKRNPRRIKLSELSPEFQILISLLEPWLVYDV